MENQCGAVPYSPDPDSSSACSLVPWCQPFHGQQPQRLLCFFELRTSKYSAGSPLKLILSTLALMMSVGGRECTDSLDQERVPDIAFLIPIDGFSRSKKSASCHLTTRKLAGWHGRIMEDQAMKRCASG